MPVNEASELLALSLIFVVHVAGGLALVWGMLEGDARPGPWWRRGGEGPDDPSSEPPLAPSPVASKRLPLSGAGPSRVRLRDETPLRAAHPGPPRRPGQPREPRRSPARR